MSSINWWFALLGKLTMIAVAMYFVIFAVRAIKDKIECVKWMRVYKHRFDKPPTAKCYCVDCKKHGEDGRCYKFERWTTADSWFCWDAEPKDKDGR